MKRVEGLEGHHRREGNLETWKEEKPCWKNGRVEREEGSKALLRNREGKSGREMRDVVSRMKEKEKRKRKEDSCWQGCFKKERWLRKVGARFDAANRRETVI